MQTASYAVPGVANRPSGTIWSGCPGEELNAQGTGYYFHDDFLGGVVTDTIVDGWNFFGTNPDVLAMSTAGGVIDLHSTGSDQDGAYIAKSLMAKFSIGSGNKVWFETRLSIEYVGATDSGVVIGFGEAALLVDNAIVNHCATMITESFAGFRLLAANTDSIDWVYALDAGTPVVSVLDVTENTALGSASAALVAGTFYKFGMAFDGKETLSIYVNGIVVGTVTLTALFPIDVDMGVILGIEDGEGTERNLYIDWVRCGAMYP